MTGAVAVSLLFELVLPSTPWDLTLGSGESGKARRVRLIGTRLMPWGAE